MNKKLLIAALLLCAAPAQADPTLWRCEGDGMEVYVTLSDKDAFILFDSNGKYLNSGALKVGGKDPELLLASLNDHASIGFGFDSSNNNRLTMYFADGIKAVKTLVCQ